MSFALTGKDTSVINGRVLTDFGIGDVVTITFPNDTTDSQTGKNGNTVFTYMENGKRADIEMKLILGSPDDKFLNSLFLTMERDFASFPLMSGSFTKRVGDGAGNINPVGYSLVAGTFKKRIEAKENVDGDKEQALAVYSMIFSQAPRSI